MYTYSFLNVSKENLDLLEELSYENKCSIISKEWKSKYNKYVVYDYEPFCSDGFEINVEIGANVQENLDFLIFLYNKRIDDVETLERIFCDLT